MIFCFLSICISMEDKESSVEIGEFSSSPGDERPNEQDMDDGGGASGSWDTLPIPDVLQNLISNGLCLLPTQCWSETARLMLVKNLSVYFLGHHCYQPGYS